MANSVSSSIVNDKFQYNINLETNSFDILFLTSGSFVDKNMKASITVSSGSVAPIIANTNLDTYFTSGTAGNNSISITPEATVTAGYVASASPAVGTSLYYKIRTGTSSAGTASVDATLNSSDNANKTGINIYSTLSTPTNSLVEPNDGTYFIAVDLVASGNSTIVSSGWFTSGALTSATASSTKYFNIQAATVTHGTTSTTSGNISITSNYSGTPTVSAELTSQSGTTGIALTSAQPSSGKYVTIISSSSSLSGKTKATRAAYTETWTAGYLPAKSATNVLASSFVEPTVEIGSANITNYLTIPTTTLSFDGGTLTNKGATATFANITSSTTDNGIYVQTKGTAGRAAVTYTNTTAGWLDAHTTATTASGAVSASTWNGTKYYITGVTVPKNIGFTITMTANDAANETSDLDVTNNANRRIDINNKGDVIISQSAKSGAVTINAYDDAGNSGTLTGAQTVTSSGAWKTNIVSAADTYYYGRTKAEAATFETNGNVTTCISPGFVAAGSLSGGGSASMGSITVSSTDPGTSYTANTSAIVPSGGYLLISSGYYNATKISLATLIKDDVNITNVSGISSQMLNGYNAYDNEGNIVTGNIPTYDGSYDTTNT